MPRKPYDTPIKTDAVDGEVTLDGPDGVGLSMTPGAAQESSERLAEAARRAARQRPAANEDDPDGDDNRQDQTSS
jgi:hypothetical protein